MNELDRKKNKCVLFFFYFSFIFVSQRSRNSVHSYNKVQQHYQINQNSNLFCVNYISKAIGSFNLLPSVKVFIHQKKINYLLAPFFI